MVLPNHHYKAEVKVIQSLHRTIRGTVVSRRVKLTFRSRNSKPSY